jgi:hypothetical protein
MWCPRAAGFFSPFHHLATCATQKNYDKDLNLKRAWRMAL